MNVDSYFRYFYRRGRGKNPPVLLVGRYRQEFWKPYVRARQHGDPATSKPLIKNGNKP